MFDSLIGQSWDNVEVILVNDGSTDGTDKIIDTYKEKFTRRGYDLKVITQENQGVATAVKNGLLEATGDFVVTPDCDDILMPGYLSEMAQTLTENPESDAVCGISTRFIDYPFSCSIGLMIPALLGRFSKSCCCIMSRRSFLNEHNIIGNIEPCRIDQEVQLVYPIYGLAKNMIFIEKFLYDYRYVLGILSEYNKADEKSKIYIDNQKEMLQKIVDKYSMPAELIYYYDIFDAQRRYSKELITKSERNEAIINVAHKLNIKKFTVNDKFLYQKITDFIINKQYESTQKPALNPGKTYFYGALGVLYARVRDNIKETDIDADFFMDKSAIGGMIFDGKPVLKPDFSIFGDDDNIIFFTNNFAYMNKFLPQIKEIAPNANIIHYNEITGYLTANF
jgi:glycosyltransferase involved in cell wall biosynthesis